jgi:MerR family transcriptional regulator, light-induced transcriptional regulator
MPNQEPLYRVGKVAELTGLSTHVLRVWERRYGAVEPRRTEKGGRLYAEDDLTRLRLLAGLVRTGHAIGTIARLSDEDLGRMLGSAPPEASELDSPELEALIERFLSAVQRFDELAADRALGQAALGLEPRDLVSGFMGRVLREVGERWASGGLRIAHEHLVSGLVRDLLVSIRRLHGGAEGAPYAVVSTILGERHEFGALMAAVLAGMHGHRVLYLGADLPAAEIVHAARQVRAELVLLSIPSDAGGNARDELATLAQGLAEVGTEVLYGGAGAPRTGAPGARFIEDFASLERHLAGRSRAPRRAR